MGAFVLFWYATFAPYITLNQNTVNFNENQGEQLASYELFLPAVLNSPGLHEAEIIVREIPNTDQAGEIEIGGLLATMAERTASWLMLVHPHTELSAPAS